MNCLQPIIDCLRRDTTITLDRPIEIHAAPTERRVTRVAQARLRHYTNPDLQMRKMIREKIAEKKAKADAWRKKHMEGM